MCLLAWPGAGLLSSAAVVSVGVVGCGVELGGRTAGDGGCEGARSCRTQDGTFGESRGSPSEEHGGVCVVEGRVLRGLCAEVVVEL